MIKFITDTILITSGSVELQTTTFEISFTFDYYIYILDL